MHFYHEPRRGKQSITDTILNGYAFYKNCHNLLPIQSLVIWYEVYCAASNCISCTLIPVLKAPTRCVWRYHGKRSSRQHSIHCEKLERNALTLLWDFKETRCIMGNCNECKKTHHRTCFMGSYTCTHVIEGTQKMCVSYSLCTSNTKSSISIGWLWF